MIFHNHPDTEKAPRVAVDYQFLAPIKVRVRLVDGTEILMGYGIGDTIGVLQPAYNYMIRGEPLKEIPLADGSHMIAFPDDLPVERV